MKVTRNGEIVTIVPATLLEQKEVMDILPMLSTHHTLSYVGRFDDGDERDPWGDPYFCYIKFQAHTPECYEARHACRKYWDTWWIWRWMKHKPQELDHSGCRMLTIRGTTEDDKYVVNDIRNTIFFQCYKLVFSHMDAGYIINFKLT